MSKVFEHNIKIYPKVYDKKHFKIEIDFSGRKKLGTNIIDALHFACYVSWLNKLNTDQTLADNGIIHELVHLTKKNTRQYQNISETRKKFNKMLKISKKNYNFS